MKLIFVGKQGSGKGTQAKKISKEFNIPHISTGDMLRGAKGELKDRVKEYMDKGQLVPDQIIIKLLKNRLKENKGGFILDGFPRTLKQAEELEKITEIDNVVRIEISDKEAVKRLSNRLNCPQCGEVFNKLTNLPENDNKCDQCGSKLYQRDDDKPEAIKKRLEKYKEEITPMLEHYRGKTEIIEIDGEQPIDKVKEEILEKLE